MDKKFKTRRIFMFAIAAGYAVLGGAEYVTILPTIWSYLESLGITEGYWLGFVTSVYSFAGAISGIIGGRLADKYTNHVKTIVMLSVAIRAIGNFQYMLGGNIGSILFARLLCGIGNAGGTVLLAEVCRTTTRTERTAILTLCNGAFDFGILIGPLLLRIMKDFDFQILSIHVTPLNAPGFLCGGLWMVFLAAVFFFLYNLAEEFMAIENAEKKLIIDCKNENSYGGSTSSDSSADAHTPPLLNAERMENLKNETTYQTYLREFLTDRYVLLLSLAFICNFCVSGFQTVIPVITEIYFDYGVFENSLIYMVGGVEAVVMFVVLAYSSEYVSDTTMQFIGWSLILLSQIWFLVIIPFLEAGTVIYRAYFLVGIVILFLGNPIAYAANASLSSKVLSSKTQGLGQGISRLAIYSGLVYGPAWAGSTVKYSALFLGGAIVILLINGMMLLLSYNDLKRSERVPRIGAASRPINNKIISNLEKGKGAKESDPLIFNVA